MDRYDEEIINAVKNSNSFSSCLKYLGLKGNSQLPSLKSRLKTICVDYSHFRGCQKISKEKVIQLSKSCNSILEILRKLNISNNQYKKVRQILIDNGCHKKFSRDEKIYNWTKSELTQAISKSYTISNCLRKLGVNNYKQNGGYDAFNRHIKKYNLDISHFKGSKTNNHKKKPYESYKTSKNLKKRVIKDRDNRCEICNINTWQDKPIIIQLHHIDGNPTNNKKDNLQLLCPNCHSQTENWGNKKRN